MDNLEIARISILRMSALRSLLFIVLGAGMLFLFSRLKKMSRYIVYAVFGILILVDMWTVDKRYLNDKNFIQARQVDEPFIPTAADNYILQDKDPSFRVFNLATDNFTIDANPSYFHKSLGGYHAAKLRRYQELIENRLFPERQRLAGVLQKDVPDSIRISTMYGLTSLNMLNTRYYIYNPDAPPLRNPAALGNAWFVKNITWVNNADEEIKALDRFVPANTAIIDRKFEPMLSGFKGADDPGSSIVLKQYAPNKLVYEVKGLKEDQLAVFSEIYYPKGWKAFVDGAETPHFRANYVLRAMVIPKGDHSLEFKFEPESYYTGNKVSLASSILLILLVLGSAGLEIYKYFKKQKADKTPAT